MYVTINVASLVLYLFLCPTHNDQGICDRVGCGRHGRCNAINNTCQCNSSYSGEFCTSRVCVPDYCNFEGRCEEIYDGYELVCHCNPERSGRRCGLQGSTRQVEDITEPDMSTYGIIVSISVSTDGSRMIDTDAITADTHAITADTEEWQQTTHELTQFGDVEDERKNFSHKKIVSPRSTDAAVHRATVLPQWFFTLITVSIWW